MGFENRPNLQGEISQVKRQNHPREMMKKVAIRRQSVYKADENCEQGG